MSLFDIFIHLDNRDRRANFSFDYSFATYLKNRRPIPDLLNTRSKPNSPLESHPIRRQIRPIRRPFQRPIPRRSTLVYMTSGFSIPVRMYMSADLTLLGSSLNASRGLMRNLRCGVNSIDSLGSITIQMETPIGTSPCHSDRGSLCRRVHDKSRLPAFRSN